ncbi:MAG: Rrf2 family transcriptional regulator [Nitrospirae bacterium]|nr:Rrf2 family transcriptional regulator [Nitrospirota bacterium]
MHITRKADYAVRCVLFLSRHIDRVSSVDEISGEMSVPKTFLAKILQRLMKTGIVNSTRGVKGGFQLARGPEEISLLDVVEAIDGPVAMNVCAVDKKMCGFSSSCSVHPVWIELRKDIKNRLKSWTFAKLAGIRKSQKVIKRDCH